MKQLQIIALLITLAAGVTACIKDKCGAVVCHNKGVCVDGQCACPVGYEGSQCETAWFEKFVGKWHADDRYIKDPSDAHFSYDIDIIQMPGRPDSLLIIGLNDSFPQLICQRTSLNSFIFKPDQKLDSALLKNNITLKSGKGEIDPSGSSISGLFSYHFKGYAYVLGYPEELLPPTHSNLKIIPVEKTLVRKRLDTTITVNFQWTR